MSTLSKRKLPEWLVSPLPVGPNFGDLKERFRAASLHTVCEEAACPNIGDCWERRTATFMILGNVCTRACAYCNVKTGWPGKVDLTEPFRLAQTVREMNLKYAVVTSVDRDDLRDGGAALFAMAIRAIHDQSPECKVEVLVPDFGGSHDSLVRVLAAEPQVLNHNIESVPRIFKKVRPKGNYRISLQLLRRAQEIAPRIPTKSGMMVGLGETTDEVLETMRGLRNHGCELLTIGQYLRPSKRHHPVIRYWHPDEFKELEVAGKIMGFKHVAAGPFVRSSYHADEQYGAAVKP